MPVDAGNPLAVDAGDAGQALPDAGGVDAGVDAGAVDAGPSIRTLSWATSPTMTRGRNHHFSFIAVTDAGAGLYALGGVDVQTVLNVVDRHPLEADGGIGPSVALASLPLSVGGMSGAVLGQTVMIAGGMTATGVTAESWVATLGDDGSLGPWRPTGNTLHPRMHSGAFAHDGAFYVVGGFRDPAVFNDVVRATPEADGGLSAWQTVGTMPSPRSHFSISVEGDYVFIAGGLAQSAFQNPPDLNGVLRGHIVDGGVSDWAVMPPLPVAIATHASFIDHGFLYVAGGINDTEQESRVWRSPLDAQHNLGPWEQVASLPEARGHVHQMPQWGDRVYSVSGAVDFSLGSTEHIAVGTFR